MNNLIELFPISLKLPEGFIYHTDFLSIEEEIQLLETIGAIELHTMIFQGFEARRKVQSFGYDYSFEKKQLSKGKLIPSELGWLVAKVANHLSIPADDFAELLITEYPVGAVINWHRDAPPFDMIAGISLLSDCTFKLRPHDKTKQTRSATKSFHVARRSLYTMQGIARDQWQHSTAPVFACEVFNYFTNATTTLTPRPARKSPLPIIGTNNPDRVRDLCIESPKRNSPNADERLLEIFNANELFTYRCWDNRDPCHDYFH